MKDLKQLAIWGSFTLVVILTLINVSARDDLPSGFVVGLAIFFVVVAPIILAIYMSKKERENRNG